MSIKKKPSQFIIFKELNDYEEISSNIWGLELLNLSIRLVEM